MNERRFLRSGRIAVLSLLLVAGFALTVSAQKVPVSFNDFHGYTGTVNYLMKVASAYPEITELLDIGKSNLGGRPIYVLVVSNMKTGATIDKLVSLRHPRGENVKNVTPMKPYQGKPGQWIDGGTHGNEFTGTEVCLYIINKLVSGYGADKDVTDLVNENCFYICPVVNPDGVFNSAEAGISQHGNSMKAGDKKRGPADLNGDGVISQFRYKDPKSRFVQDDKDPRIMIRIGQIETTTKERWSVVTEGTSGDRGGDAENGVDLNRNYPEGWWKDDDTPGGSGYYPTSAPETRALTEFFTNHTNILLTQSYHTSGGFTYRPFGRWPDSRMDPRDLAVFDKIFGPKYLELIGESAADAAKEARSDDAGLIGDQAQRQPRSAAAQTAAAETPRGWQHPYDEIQKRPYGYGLFLDWAYAEFGAWALSTELWNWQKDTKGLPGYNGENDRAAWERAFITWQEKALGGKAFLPWKKFKHPELGEGEIGGWTSRYSISNAVPGETLTGVCETHYQFEIFRAKLLPRLRITDAKAKVLYSSDSPKARVEQSGDTFTVRNGESAGRYKIVEVRATIENTGKLPTQTAIGAQLPGNRQDVVWLIGDPGKVRYIQGTAWMQLGVVPGTLTIPGPAENPAAQMPAAAPMGMRTGPGGFGRMQQFRAEDERVKPSGGKREVSWLVAVEGNGPLKIVVTSQKGGTQVKDLGLN